MTIAETSRRIVVQTHNLTQASMFDQSDSEEGAQPIVRLYNNAREAEAWS
jgi:hypothetical protein